MHEKQVKKKSLTLSSDQSAKFLVSALALAESAFCSVILHSKAESHSKKPANISMPQ